MEPRKTSTFFLYATILTILFSLGLSLFLRSSFFSIAMVKIEGIEKIPLLEIERLTSDVNGENIISYDQERLRQNVLLHPLVESVEFDRKLPKTLVVRVKERTPVALVAVPNGVVEVDEKGTFLRRMEGWPNKSYPVINGVKIPETSGPGQVLEEPGLDTSLFLIGQAPKELTPLIGEIYVNSIQQITLYLTSGVEVRLGKTDDWKVKLEALYKLINDEGYKSFENEVRYIDFTAAKPVVGR